MIRVLQVYPQLNNAGTERVIRNLYEHMDRTAVQFDFLVERPGELDGQLRAMGARIHYLYRKSRGQYYRELLRFFRAHPEYRTVHTHTHARMDLVLKAAKACAVPCRVAHSHNARNDLPPLAWTVKGLTSLPMERAATHFFACSANAAKWLFPHRVKQCRVLYNGICLTDYLYREAARGAVRAGLGIGPEDFVMIHVGRFSRQKNHEYLVDILSAYRKRCADNWKILLVGDGPLQDDIRRRVHEAGLSEHVLFLGSRTDVPSLLSAADLFVFPSLHEGLGIVVIEAQAAALPCLVSDAVPAEAELGIGLLHTMSLGEDPDSWARKLAALRSQTTDRTGLDAAILASPYNIDTIALQMQRFYQEQETP